MAEAVESDINMYICVCVCIYRQEVSYASGIMEEYITARSCFGQIKIIQMTQMTETVAHLYTSESYIQLSKSFPMNINKTMFG